MFKLVGLVMLIAAAAWFVLGRQGPALAEGAAAADFKLPDQDGKIRRLTDYRGKWVALYFYPKDDTPGCTREACAFRDDMAALRGLGVQVLGVSLDDTASHAAFARKHGLPFPLLADVKGETTRRYGALMDLGLIRFAKRHTFLIDPAGRIAKIYRKVSPQNHASEIIADARRLAGSRAAR